MLLRRKTFVPLGSYDFPLQFGTICLAVLTDCVSLCEGQTKRFSMKKTFFQSILHSEVRILFYWSDHTYGLRRNHRNNKKNCDKNNKRFVLEVSIKEAGNLSLVLRHNYFYRFIRSLPPSWIGQSNIKSVLESSI